VRVQRIDHFVLTVEDLDRTIAFYVDALGMTETTFRAGRRALTFGTSKINLHQRGREFDPKAFAPTPGSADVCLVVEEPIDTVVAELMASGIQIEEGPVERTGAGGPILSVYVRDPDGNLIELSNYLEPGT
jgi:catechol 2,3-dioxygenase-like lactoylglutathione lyase family enzyme